MTKDTFIHIAGKIACYCLLAILGYRIWQGYEVGDSDFINATSSLIALLGLVFVLLRQIDAEKESQKQRVAIARSAYLQSLSQQLMAKALILQHAHREIPITTTQKQLVDLGVQIEKETVIAKAELDSLAPK